MRHFQLAVFQNRQVWLLIGYCGHVSFQKLVGPQTHRLIPERDPYGNPFVYFQTSSMNHRSSFHSLGSCTILLTPFRMKQYFRSAAYAVLRFYDKFVPENTQMRFTNVSVRQSPPLQRCSDPLTKNPHAAPRSDGLYPLQRSFKGVLQFSSGVFNTVPPDSTSIKIKFVVFLDACHVSLKRLLGAAAHASLRFSGSSRR
jgi:hypothetical protein